MRIEHADSQGMTRAVENGLTAGVVARSGQHAVDINPVMAGLDHIGDVVPPVRLIAQRRVGRLGKPARPVPDVAMDVVAAEFHVEAEFLRPPGIDQDTEVLGDAG